MVIYIYIFVIFFLTCWQVYSSLWLEFFKQSKLQKIRLIRIIEILLSLTNNNPSHHRTCHTPSDSSIPYLFYYYPFHLSHTYLQSLQWLDCVTEDVRLPTSDYTSSYDHQKTTCILSRRVCNCNRPWRLSSYAAIYNFSPNCHPSILCCGDFLIKCYCYLLSI